MDSKVINRNIKGYLAQLSNNVATNNALGLYNINRSSEDLVAQLLNKVFLLNLRNANDTDKKNYPAVDLLDKSTGMSVQVTSNPSSDKLTKTFQKFINHKIYNHFSRLMFYFLTDKNPNYYKSTREKALHILSDKLKFDFSNDILNNSSIGTYIDNILDLNLLIDISKLLEEKLALPEGGKMDPSRGYIIQKRLNSYAGYSLDEIVGREELLNIIYEKLKSRNFILLTGLGGIGKTTIARAYLEKYRLNYDHLAYVDVTNSITDSLLLNLSDIDKSYEYDETIDKNTNLQNLVSKLRTIYNTVLVIDNCNNEEDLRSVKPILECLDWKIIITSRAQPASFVNDSIKVESLAAEDAYKLFTKFYEPINNKESETIEEIIQNAYYHTKLIILLAKTASNNPLLTLDILAQKVADNSYDEDSVDISVDLNNEERSVYEFILMLFNPGELDTYQRHYLRLFSILPNQEIPINHLFELFEAEQNQKYFINTLNKLITKGWIEKYSNKFYRIHPLVQLVSLKKLNPTIDECSKLVINLNNVILETYNLVSLSLYIPYCESLIMKFGENIDRNIAVLLFNTSKIYAALSQFNKAVSSNLSALSIFDKLPEPFRAAEAQCHGLLGAIYERIGNYDDSIESYKNCLQIQETILLDTHPDLAVTYSNLSILLGQTGQPNLTEYYLMKAIEVFKFHYFNNHSVRVAYNLSNSYDQLGGILSWKARTLNDNYYSVKALRYAFRALVIYKRDIKSEDHLLGHLYNNISLIYRNLNELDKSISYLDKSMEIKRNFLAADHADIALGHHNYAVLFEMKGQFTSALEEAETALRIQEAVFSPGQFNLESTKELILRIKAKV